MPYANRLDLERFLQRLLSRSILTPEEQDAILGLPSYLMQVREP